MQVKYKATKTFTHKLKKISQSNRALNNYNIIPFDKFTNLISLIDIM